MAGVMMLFYPRSAEAQSRAVSYTAESFRVVDDLGQTRAEFGWRQGGTVTFSIFSRGDVPHLLMSSSQGGTHVSVWDGVNPISRIDLWADAQPSSVAPDAPTAGISVSTADGQSLWSSL